MKVSTAEFLEALFGGYLEEHPGFIEIREINKGQTPKQEFYSSVSALANGLEEFEGNVYFGAAPRQSRKGDKSAVNHVTCLWVDLDVGIEGHRKTSRFDTIEQARASIGKSEHVPSIVVFSGHGLQCYWLLREPEEACDPARVERIMKGLILAVGGDRRDTRHKPSYEAAQYSERQSTREAEAGHNSEV